MSESDDDLEQSLALAHRILGFLHGENSGIVGDALAQAYATYLAEACKGIPEAHRQLFIDRHAEYLRKIAQLRLLKPR